MTRPDQNQLDAIIAELKSLQGHGDTETAHARADDILCRLLTDLGYPEVVAEYEKIDKWFA